MKKILLLTVLIISSKVVAQSAAPIPIEMLFGNNSTNFQLTFKRPFIPGGKLTFFSLASFVADNEDKTKNSFTIPLQAIYSISKEFGIYTGAENSSATGLQSFAGLNHLHFNPTWLSLTQVSLYLNDSSDFKFFGIYEYKPKLSEKLRLYSRIQLLYKHNTKANVHQRSFIQFRLGVKQNRIAYGMGANLDQFGPQKTFKQNAGVFLRWDFRD